jgi:hypothetical protein
MVRCRAMRAAAILVLGSIVLAAGVAADSGARAPKLGTEEPPAPAERPADSDVARPLPRTAAVCQDRGAKRCWAAAREADCRAGEIFRVVIDGDDVGVALAQCREQLAR